MSRPAGLALPVSREPSIPWDSGGMLTLIKNCWVTLKSDDDYLFNVEVVDKGETLLILEEHAQRLIEPLYDDGRPVDLFVKVFVVKDNKIAYFDLKCWPYVEYKACEK